MQLRTRRSGILTTTADLALQIGSLLEALDRARSAMRAADPSGRLWAACVLFLRQAQRFGVSASRARGVRAQRERRLGELAERAGDIRAAIVHYRAALASQAGVGVTRRLARLVAVEPTAATPPRGFANPSRAGRPPADSTRLVAATERSGGGGHPARASFGEKPMKPRIQIVGRLPVDLNRRVRAAATRRKVSLNTFLIEALTHAVAARPSASA